MRPRALLTAAAIALAVPAAAAAAEPPVGVDFQLTLGGGLNVQSPVAINNTGWKTEMRNHHASATPRLHVAIGARVKRLYAVRLDVNAFRFEVWALPLCSGCNNGRTEPDHAAGLAISLLLSLQVSCPAAPVYVRIGGGAAFYRLLSTGEELRGAAWDVALGVDLVRGAGLALAAEIDFSMMHFVFPRTTVTEHDYLIHATAGLALRGLGARGRRGLLW